MSMLMARRLVEAEVPFVTVFWNDDNKIAKKKGCNTGGWDTHADNFTCLEKYLLPSFDRPFSALLEDLAQRGLLEDTLVVVTSEMGRNPKIGDRRSGGIKGTGRDHWTHLMTVRWPEAESVVARSTAPATRCLLIPWTIGFHPKTWPKQSTTQWVSTNLWFAIVSAVH